MDEITTNMMDEDYQIFERIAIALERIADLLWRPD